MSGPGDDISILVEGPAWSEAEPACADLAREAALAALAAAGRGPDADLAVLLADDDLSAELNGRFRGRSGPTNVLSFPAPPGPHGHLGDIALAYGVCAREAREQEKSLAHHLQHLVAHGVLHLLGYDHEAEAEAQAMEELERRVMASLGAPDPYRNDGEPA